MKTKEEKREQVCNPAKENTFIEVSAINEDVRKLISIIMMLLQKLESEARWNDFVGEYYSDIKAGYAKTDAQKDFHVEITAAQLANTGIDATAFIKTVQDFPKFNIKVKDDDKTVTMYPVISASRQRDKFIFIISRKGYETMKQLDIPNSH